MNTNPCEPISIGQLSKLTQCNIETIRYYERIGILPEPPRSFGGHRLFRQVDVKRLSFIRRSRELGFSLQDIRGMLQLVDGQGGSCDQIYQLTLDHAQAVHNKIRDLKKIEAVLRTMAGECRNEKIPVCPIIDVLFEP